MHRSNSPHRILYICKLNHERGPSSNCNYSQCELHETNLSFNIKVSKCKLGPFEHAQSMFKQPTRLGYIGNIINYLFNLLYFFPRGLWKDQEGSSTFLPLTLLMHIDRFRLVLVTCMELSSVAYLSVHVAVSMLQPSTGKLGGAAP